MRIGVIGAGGWGTALTILLSDNGHEVALWQFDPSVAEEMRAQRQNCLFLPGVSIPDGILISSTLGEVISGRDMLVFAVPSQFMRSVARRVGLLEAAAPLVVSGTKGIEDKTLKRMSEVLLEEVPGLTMDRFVALSGPSHAEEVARRIPTTVVAASVSQSAAEMVQQAFMAPYFRVYTSSDVIGVELGGALKNIIALASGICDGLGLGDNAKGALMTRGLGEITRLGLCMGARAETFAGLSGMGDLVTTCISRHSRNRFVGEEIGKGRRLEDILSEMVMVAEGVQTTRSAYQLSQRLSVEMPITERVHAVLFEGYDPGKGVRDLMTRDAKPEIWA